MLSAEGQIVYFEAATIIARKIRLCKEPVILSHAHRGQMAKAEIGRLIIDREWYPKRSELGA